MYPICVQYFSFTDGRQTKLLDFFEEPSETAESICKSITSTLSKHRLSMSSVSAFSADNTNANFGKHKSAYTLLHNENNKLIKSGCLAHIVNNSFKHGLQKLDFDIETVVLKIYSHFSSSASRRENLKSFFDFAQVDWEELVKHVPTRWLSLGPELTGIDIDYHSTLSHQEETIAQTESTNCIDLNNSEESSSLAALLVLPFLFSPVSSKRKKGSTVCWRPSKIEMRDGFILHISS
ncbi:uncharacterized protein LOC107885566 [Acyrthosiphon pisum]|uniref:Uncharacterized protein n=1 Tax=Acyrthosiphon pisum TaxID=7029 RepID=A0A8R2HB62_ACYPI|nr:uncharacterized protein LOC107885566 [Acyrthosiphon pisum]|eukprot:XP_016664704.1 PREDICTED: uncharacterized protein LOC107885566 [Acyrthosiphon pisum]